MLTGLEALIISQIEAVILHFSLQDALGLPYFFDVLGDFPQELIVFCFK